MSIKAQSAAAVSRQNSSQDENFDSDEIQSISSQNSSADENLIISSSLNRQFIRSIFEDTEMSIINVLIKARKIALLNESAD
jgi:hypothetical protein